MRLGMVPVRRPVCIDRDATVVAAGRLMRDEQVDELVVTEPRQGKAAPAGILSAREIVTRVLACGLDARVLTVGDLLWTRLPVVRVTDTVTETLELLCASGSGALPMVHGDGRLAGVVSLDDVLKAFAGRDAAGAGRFPGR